MNQNNLLQNPHDFTVQIRHTTTDAIMGTGVVVSLDGLVVTCAHIVRAAGVNPHEKAGLEVGIYFPQLAASRPRAYRATVAASLPYSEDDIVLLRLAGGQTPLAPEQIAVLSAADRSRGHMCRSYGYLPAGEGATGATDGIIVGLAEPPTDHRLQARPLHLRTSQPGAFLPGAAVLDMEHNLVVGIISDLPTSGAPGRTIGLSQAVNARVLGELPFQLPLRSEPLPPRPAPLPRIDVAAARKLAALVTGTSLTGLPPSLDVWVGREEMLQTISDDWADPRCRVTGLIGIGGEGKTSLLQCWLERLQRDRSQPQPDGIFWWSFHARPNIDELFEAALFHLGNRIVDTHQYPSSRMRVQIIGAMLHAGRYLFILDGLEAVQHQQGDQAGRVASAELHDLLQYFAAPQSESFCLITSRTPVADLLAYASYRHRELPRLGAAEGRTLLARLGVQGDEQSLEHLVAELEGHALSLSLLAAYLVEKHGGHVTALEPMIAGRDEPRMQRIQETIARRLRVLTKPERTFLMLLSAIRLPLDESAVGQLFRPRPGLRERLLRKSPQGITAPLASLNDGAFEALIKRLLSYRLVQHDSRSRHYSLHPMLREHFAADLLLEETADLHLRIKDYYLSQAGEMPGFINLNDLEPLIEAFYHACRAAAYDEAFAIYWQRIEQGERQAFRQQIGAYETLLALMRELFPQGSYLSREPLVQDARLKQVILDTVGFCLVSLDRMDEAASVYATKNRLLVQGEDWHSACIGCRNLANLSLHIGALDEAARQTAEALELARQLEHPPYEVAARAQIAWIDHLRGDVEAAGRAFQQAAALQQKAGADQPPLSNQEGIWYAEHLRSVGQLAEARRLTRGNLALCEANHWITSISQCHRMLGDLEAEEGRSDAAMQHYEQALSIAREIGHPPLLIEVLLARGRMQVQRQEAEAALRDLNEALEYAVGKGYRLYEADSRAALALMYAAMGDDAAAQAAEHYACAIGAATGYSLATRTGTAKR